jgi:GNAT superfamily N-acetyltransferase
LKAAGNGVGYPRQYDVDVVLRDGSTVHLRPALSADLEGLTSFLSGLSEESKVFRFLHAVKETAHLAASFLELDYQKRFSLVVLHGEPEVIVGHGFYAVTGPAHAEVAFAVADELQGHGLGTILLGQLAQAAVGLPPLTGADAERMLSGLVSFPPLEGYRGGSRVDMAALKGLLLQLSALAEDLPEVVELDLNPVVATSSGVVTVDARLRVEARDPQRPEGSLFRAVRQEA